MKFEPSDIALTSPGRALSERQRFEHQLTSKVDRALLQFLEDAKQHILEQDEVQPIAIQELFNKTILDLTDSLEAAPETQHIIREHFEYSDFPELVHDTASYLLSEAKEEQLSQAEIETILTEGLDYDEPSITGMSVPNSLEASAAPRMIGQLLARSIGRGKRWRDKARDTSRTASTNALNEAQQRALQRMPFTHKQWITRRDDDVRETHADADGQIVPKASLFQVGTATLAYPGQGTFPPEEVINCRCVMIGVYADGSTR